MNIDPNRSRRTTISITSHPLLRLSPRNRSWSATLTCSLRRQWPIFTWGICGGITFGRPDPRHPGGHGVWLALVYELRHPQQPAEIDCSSLMSTSGPISYYRGFGAGTSSRSTTTIDRFHLPEDLASGTPSNPASIYADWRKEYFQNNNPGGVFTFDNVFTCYERLNAPQVTGWLRLNWDMSRTARRKRSRSAPPTFQTVYYQGYFAHGYLAGHQQTHAQPWFRYEVPGVCVARHGWADTFNPTETNPCVGLPGRVRSGQLFATSGSRR